MSGVRVLEVSKRYPGAEQPALSGLTLDVPDQEFFVLLGPSGCGKSTLLKLVAGLEEPSEGWIYLDDELVNFVSPSRRNVAMVFQNYALYPQMRVLENIAFPLRMRKVRRAERERLAREVAASLDIEPLLGRSVGQLSGGQRQRVAVARALIRRPRVLLMDEPLSNLDALLRIEMRDELMRLHRTSATTVLYVTHDQVEATTMADRVGVMRDGRLAQVGPPEEIYRRPASRFVAGFIGSPPMNFLDGRLASDEGRPAFVSPGLTIELPGTLARALDGRVAAGGDATLGIRPQAVRLTPPEGARLRGEVQLLESLGDTEIVIVEVGGRPVRAVVHRTARPSERETVGLELDPGELHLFDGDGEAIR